LQSEFEEDAPENGGGGGGGGGCLAVFNTVE